MDAFTPLSALAGGALIGLASALLWLGNGRIAGISGIFGQLLPPAQTVIWRVVFLAALVLGTLAAACLIPGLGVGGPGGKPAELVSAPAWTRYSDAGLARRCRPAHRHRHQDRQWLHLGPRRLRAGAAGEAGRVADLAR